MTDLSSNSHALVRDEQRPIRLKLSLLTAIVLWLRRPARPPDLPEYLRRDVGLTPEHLPAHLRGIHRNPADLTIIYSWKR